MEIYEIKAVLPRSNPLLLRQFTIGGERNLKEVGQVLQILLGWKEMWPCSFVDGRQMILPDTALKAAFAGRSAFSCVLGAKGKQGHTWEFRLKLVGTAQQNRNPDGCPAVVRYRGDNLPQDTVSTAQYNQLAQNWDGSSRVYFDMFCNTHSRRDYLFSAGDVNRILKRRFSAASPGESDAPILELDYKNAIGIEDNLGVQTVAELKDMARRWGIVLPSGLRKDMMIRYLAKGMGTAMVLNGVLDDMTLGQYRAFRMICCGDGKRDERGAMEETIRMLSIPGYLSFDYFAYGKGRGEVICTREMLEAYEEWLETADEPEYLRLALLRSTIVACTRLYGCLEKERWKQLVPRIAERKNYTDEEMESEWRKIWINSYMMKITSEDRNFLYCTDNIDQTEAKELAKLQKSMQLYIPKLAEIRQLEAGGFLYPDPKGKELERFMQTEYGMRKADAHDIHYQIYQSLQFGVEPEKYADWLIPRLSASRRRGGAALKKLFGELVPLTRQIIYGGYTEAEMERMR